MTTVLEQTDASGISGALVSARKAIAVFEQYLERNPGEPVAVHQLGQVAQDGHRPARAASGHSAELHG